MLRVPFDCPPGMKVHPVLDLIPMMSEDEFDRLVWSIRKIGLVDPIVHDEDGRILDGRCRLQACEIAKVKPKLASPKDAVAAYIFAKNMARRNLNQGQRAMIIALLIDKIEKGLLQDDGRAYFILDVNFSRRHLTASQLQIADAMFGEPDYPEKLVIPEARIIVRHRHIADQVRDGLLSLGEAYKRAIEYEQEIAKHAEDHRRLVQLRDAEPFLAAQVAEGELTLDQAIAAAEEKAKAPVLAEHAEAIRAAGKRVIADIIEIGWRLSECKKMLGHGNWLPWLEREFGWSDRTALNFMRVYDLSGKSETVADLSLPVSGLYLLAAPSAPEETRNAILSRAEAGEVLSVADIRQAIDQARGKSSEQKPDRLRELCERMSTARPDDPLVKELHLLLFGRGVR
jgi:hypothetical protein